MTHEENKCVVCGLPGKGHMMLYCDRTPGGPWCSEHFRAATNCDDVTHGEGCETRVFQSDADTLSFLDDETVDYKEKKDET